MMTNSKQKGARFERQIAGMLRAEGYDCRRGQQYSGKADEQLQRVKVRGEGL